MNRTVLFITCCFFYACNTHVVTPPVTDPAKQDEAILHDSTRPKPGTLRTDSAFFGIYQTPHPCADCNGLVYTIAFYPSKKFRLEVRKGKENMPVRHSDGTWLDSSGTILLQHLNETMRYQWNGNTLVLLQNGKQIKLDKQNSARDNKVWQEKEKSGIELFGLGNEPFWNLEIDEQKALAFRLAEWPDAKHVTLLQKQTATDSTIYKALAGTDTLEVTVYPLFCSDGMSDFIYDNKIQVRYNSHVYHGCAIHYY